MSVLSMFAIVMAIRKTMIIITDLLCLSTRFIIVVAINTAFSMSNLSYAIRLTC